MNKELYNWLKEQTYEHTIGGYCVIEQEYEYRWNWCWGEIVQNYG